MAFIRPRDRVLEQSTSNSQTIFALAGALDSSFNAFSAFMSIGDTTIGGVVEPGVAFKSGILTLSAANQITVSTIKESKGSFSASGIKQVFMGKPALLDLIPDPVTQAIGYLPGAGGAVTQSTSKSTAVTINKACGQITMHNASLGGGASAVFTLANSAMAATDIVVVNIQGGYASPGTYRVQAEGIGAGGCFIVLTNISGGALSEAVVLNFAITKAVNA